MTRIDYFCFNEGAQCDAAYALVFPGAGGAPPTTVPAYNVFAQWAG